MAQENDLQTLRDELNKIQGQTRRSRRKATIGIVVLLLALMLSFVYAFVQSVKAEKYAEEALRQRMLAEQAKVHADRNAEEAMKQAGIAHEQQQAAELAISQAKAELEKCRKGRK